MGWRAMFWSQQQDAGTGAAPARAKTLGTKRFEGRGGRKRRSQSLHPQKPSGNWGAAPTEMMMARTKEAFILGWERLMGEGKKHQMLFRVSHLFPASAFAPFSPTFSSGP